MGYIAELWKTTKTGPHKGIPRLWKKIPVDNVTMIKIGHTFTICNTTSEVKYYVEKIEHIYYGKQDEYYVRYFIMRA